MYKNIITYKSVKYNIQNEDKTRAIKNKQGREEEYIFI